MNIKLRNNQEGFTLGELTVALSLFMIVIAIAMGTFIQSIRSERTIVSNTSMNNNIAQTLERISREVRTGYAFGNSTSSELKFVNARNDDVSYTLSDASIIRCLNSECSPITSDDVFIDRLKFILSGINERDGLPPRVTISMGVVGINEAILDFQTTISARDIGS